MQWMGARKYNRFELLNGLDRINCVPHSLISQKGENPSVLFVQVGAEADIVAECPFSSVELFALRQQ